MKHKIKLKKAAVAIVGIVTLLSVPAVERAAFAGQDRPASKGGSTADLALSAWIPEQVNEGDEFWVEYHIANNGPDPAEGRKLTMQFDSSKATFIESHECRASGNTVTCTVEDYHLPIFPGGQEGLFRPVFRALSSGGTFTATAHVTSRAKDPNRSNNTNSVSVPIVFEYECGGSVAHTAQPVTESPYPAWMHSCRYPATSLSERAIRLELIPPHEWFYGSLEAEVRSGPAGTVVAKISAVFVRGQPIGLTRSTTGTLPAGDWVLTVSAQAINQSFSIPGMGSESQYWVYAPLSYGTYAAVVTAA